MINFLRKGFNHGRRSRGHRGHVPPTFQIFGQSGPFSYNLVEYYVCLVKLLMFYRRSKNKINNYYINIITII